MLSSSSSDMNVEDRSLKGTLQIRICVRTEGKEGKEGKEVSRGKEAGGQGGGDHVVRPEGNQVSRERPSISPSTNIVNYELVSRKPCSK